MSEFLQKFSGGELTAVTFWVVMGSIWLTWILAEQWRRSRKSEMEMLLKQEMLQRGMSADEIVKVLSASAGRPRSNDQNPTPKT